MNDDLQDREPIAAGSRVGPYQLESSLGAGGMGEVFRAMDTRLRRTVAVKFLLPMQMAGASQRRRFLAEARAASALNHPNIVTLYDISSHEGHDFLVMEHIPGQTLKALIREGMPVENVFRIGAQVASALGAAHEAGIVHRDVKPANIMVTPAGQAKVLDFGIARMVSADFAAANADSATTTQLTEPGQVLGTTFYMSPEQAQGLPADGRSDIFSLGCVLYEAATGCLPFRGATALAVMHEILVANPALPSSLRAELPYRFDWLMAGCLEKNPEKRPAACEVTRQLEDILTPAPAPVSLSERRTVAAIPFRFRTALPEDQFLSLALTESVVNRLASSSSLVVRPVASVMRYAGVDVDWRDVARELNVDYVVEGTIQKSGTRVRVLVQTVHASDSTPLQSSRHDGEMGDLFGLQDRIADSVSGVFIPPAGAEAAPAVSPTDNPLAYELYLRANVRVAHWNKFDIGSAIEMLSRVVEIDPNFADAWGSLANACSQMGMHFDSDPQWFERAEYAIARTLELDPVQCDALCARGQILWSPSRGFQHLPALRAMNAALKIHPGRYNFRQFRGAILFHLGFHDQAIRDLEESLLANPGFALALAARAVVAEYKGDYALANELYTRSLHMDPTLLHANVFSPRAPILLGRLGEAKERIRRARQIVPEETQLTSLEGLLAAHEGDFARAEQLADDACSGRVKTLTHTHHAWHCAAGVYALCGRHDKALHWLRMCHTTGLPNYVLFTTDPDLKSLRDEPEFMTLMSEMRRESDVYRNVVGC